MSVETAHGSAYANQSMAKSSKWMIEVAPKGTTGQIRTNRQVTQPIQKTSSNTRKIPETTGKQPLKEGELKCYECGQKGHMQPQCPKLRSQRIAAVVGAYMLISIYAQGQSKYIFRFSLILFFYHILFTVRIL